MKDAPLASVAIPQHLLEQKSIEQQTLDTLNRSEQTLGRAVMLLSGIEEALKGHAEAQQAVSAAMLRVAAELKKHKR